MNKGMKWFFIISFSTIGLILVLNMVLGRPTPISNPEVHLYTEVYETNTYTIYKKTFIPDEVHIMIGYSFGDEEDSCGYGVLEQEYIMVKYRGQYYDLRAVDQLRLFGCDVLQEHVIIEQ